MDCTGAVMVEEPVGNNNVYFACIHVYTSLIF